MLDQVEHQRLPETSSHSDADDSRKPANVIYAYNGKISLNLRQLRRLATTDSSTSLR
jgi:hypothetical protein